jgi:hypothetical protein
LWAKYRKCGFAVKKQVDFRTKMPVMRKKPFLAFVQIMGKKVYENKRFGRRNGQNGRRERIIRANRIKSQKTNIQHITQSARIFCAKTFALPCIFAKLFANLYMPDYLMV